MPIAYVYWETAGLETEMQFDTEGEPHHTGILTTEPEDSPDGAPILVEEVTRRLYRPEDLPPGTVVYIESAPGDLPAMAQLAKRAGFRVEMAGP